MGIHFLASTQCDDSFSGVTFFWSTHFLMREVDWVSEKRRYGDRRVATQSYPGYPSDFSPLPSLPHPETNGKESGRGKDRDKRIQDREAPATSRGINYQGGPRDRRGDGKELRMKRGRDKACRRCLKWEGGCKEGKSNSLTKRETGWVQTGGA